MPIEKKPCANFCAAPRFNVGPCSVKLHLVVVELDCKACNFYQEKAAPDEAARSGASTAEVGASLTPPTVNTGEGNQNPQMTAGGVLHV